MNLEKLGMMLLAQYVGQFESVKDHLSRALGECMKAAEETVKIVQRGGQQLSVHPLQASLLSKVLSPLEIFLHQSGKRLSPEELYAFSAASRAAEAVPEPAAHKLKSHIIQSLIDSLDDEIRRTSAEDLADNPLKVQALETVKRVLLDHGVDAAEAPKPADPAPDLTLEPVSDDAPLDAADALISLHTQSMADSWGTDDAAEEAAAVLQVETDDGNDAGTGSGSIRILDFRPVKTA